MKRQEYKEITKQKLQYATRIELERLLKEYGYYNDYKNYSNSYIIDLFCRKAYDHKKIYKIF